MTDTTPTPNERPTRGDRIASIATWLTALVLLVGLFHVINPLKWL